VQDSECFILSVSEFKLLKKYICKKKNESCGQKDELGGESDESLAAVEF
jgi:hypothetical protein